MRNFEKLENGKKKSTLTKQDKKALKIKRNQRQNRRERYDLD